MVERPNSDPLAGDGMAPLFSGQFLELMLQLRLAREARPKGPMTLNRKWAQRSCDRRLLRFFSHTDADVFVFSTTSVVRVAILRPSEIESPGILCGKKNLPQQERSKGIEVVVRGDRNLSNSQQLTWLIDSEKLGQATKAGSSRKSAA